ncbi:MAG: DUF58 domain-containing protein [Anaerolineales bacterium]
MLFDESTLRKLTQLSLVAARIRAGAIKGERRSSRRGSSVEFADYRAYAPGDDLRRLDWNIYARLERPFIKLFEEEEDLAVYLLLDTSRSMGWGAALSGSKGEGELDKFRYALRLAAGLGAVALACGDRLVIAALRDGSVMEEFGPARGQAALPRLFRFLEGLEAQGTTDLDASLRQFFVTPRRAGLVILLSDLFSAQAFRPPLRGQAGSGQGWEAGLRQALGRGHEAALLHILSPDELDPPLAGDLQLVDIESGQTQDVSLDGGLRALYRQRARAWLQSTQAACRKQGVRYLQLTTSLPWERALLLEMRQSGMVK